MATSAINEFDVEALVDSQLTWEEEKRVRAALALSPALQEYHRQISAQKKLLVSWWGNTDETIPGSPRSS